MDKKQIETAVAKVISQGNPYITTAVKFFIDHKPVYLFGGEALTAEQLNEEYRKTAKKDIENGFKDRKVGYYDKWYRYSRADEGRAYDEGVKLALSCKDCVEEMHIIPCMH